MQNSDDMNAENIVVSIIIPVYNVATYLPICLESAMFQSFENLASEHLEIIVVNDKSPDNAKDIVQAYQKQDKRIVYIENKKNGGAGLARTNGIKQARGDYIYFLDGDDFIHQNTIETMYKKMISNTLIDVVVGGYIPVSDKTYTLDAVNHLDIKKLKDKHFVYKKNVLLHTTDDILMRFGTSPSKNGILPPMWNKLYKKSLFENNNIDVLSEVLTEDLATMPKILLKAKQVLLSSEGVYFYRLRDNSALSQYNIAMNHTANLIDSHIASIESVKAFFITHNAFDEYKPVLKKMISANLLQTVLNPQATQEVKRSSLAMFFDFCAKEMMSDNSLIDETVYGDICFQTLLYPNITLKSARRWVFFASLSPVKKILYMLKWIIISPKFLWRKKS